MENEYLSSEEEILDKLSKVSDQEGGGSVLYVDEDNEAFCWNREGNTMFIGETGCGKTFSGTLPALFSIIQNREGFISIDTKLDHIKYTYEYARLLGYEMYILNFTNPMKSDTIDLFDLIHGLYTSGDINKKQVAIEILEDIAYSLIPIPQSTAADPFWNACARSVFISSALFLLDHADRSELNIASLVNFIATLKERNFPGKTNIEEICSLYPNENFAMLMNTLRVAPPDTANSILASTFEPLSMFVKSEAVRSLISTPGLDIAKLDCRKPLGIYILLPDERIDNYSGLAGVLLSQIAGHFFQIAREKYDGRLPRRQNIIIEELGNLGKSIPRLDLLLSAGRSRNIRTFFVLQSISQLDDLYGKSKATTIVSNANIVVAFRTNHLETLENLSKRCGEVNDESCHFPRRRVTPDELGCLQNREALILLPGGVHYIFQFPDLQDFVNMKYWKPAEYPTSNLNIDLPLFNVQKYISEAKDAKASNSSTSEDDMSSSAFSLERFQALLKTGIESNSKKPIETPSPNDPEDEFFMQLLERKRVADPMGKDFHLYKLTISDYLGLPKTELILKRAGVLRMNPVNQKNGEPFNVYFLSDENAMEFSTFVCANGGKAVKVIL